MASSLGDTPEQAAEEAAERLSDALPDLCTCTVSTITLRRERAEDCPVHPTKRVTFDSIAWERIPEQCLCICAHEKGRHVAPDLLAPNRWACATPVVGPPPGCKCPGFHDVDHPMPLGAFRGRLLHEIPWVSPTPVPKGERLPGNPQTRADIALLWAWKQSGLALTEPRTWALWMADSKRVWRAWRDAGSPITAFGKETSFGVASIPALEDR